MGMRAAVPTTLNKGSVFVLFIIDALPCERSYLFWQLAAIIRHFYPFGIFIAGINHRVFAGNLLPLK